MKIPLNYESAIDYIQELQAQLQATAEREAKLEKALVQIQQWTKAYPLEMFPEPDFKLVRCALNNEGLSLDAVSASNMRHVIKGVSGIVDAALTESEPK